MPRFTLFLFCAIFLGALFPADQARAFAPKRYHENQIYRGRASWYGSDQGRATASGERFNARKFTAAHRSLPFGTIIHVTNLNNGLSVDVRINDRGPWAHSRILDLTSAAADALQMKRSGIVPVEFQIIKLGTPGKYHRQY